MSGFNTAALPPLRDIIREHGLSAKKKLGQHFLLDTNLIAKIVRAAGNLRGQQVVEIGPGPGGLTRALLTTDAAKIWAIEKDERAIAALHLLSSQAGERLQILHEDALEVDLVSLVPAPRQIVANLPYNIATPLLFLWLDAVTRDPAAFSRLTLMFQKEVAARLVAVPETKDYGRLSVMSQWLCEVKEEFDIPPAAFTPPPQVISTVVTLIPRPQPVMKVSQKALEKVLVAGFGQRRKMLRGALKSLGIDSVALLEAAGISPTRRAEELTVAEWCGLAGQYSKLSTTFLREG